jgi:phage shock protein PspC (stress-responsive transcriptional regulator)
MKTIINIALGGRNISIEDTAYDKIKEYTESLRQYYINEDGRDEIIADIESRFSELMSEKIRKGAPHITDADVDEMITSMGRPEDFDNAAASNDTASQKQSGSNYSFGEKRRLFRDESNKVIGGVCGGIANWLNTDPTIVRILFAIISFGGFGSGILIYFFLWIFLPSRNMSVYNGKRLYRNPDDKVIGGVAGGLGAYFKMNSNTVRLILSLPIILSMIRSFRFWGWNEHFFLFPNLIFGGLTGAFIFVYIVLWIILPEAKSPYEKMEMYGKTIDVNTIKQNVQNSMGDLKDKLQDWGKEVKDSASKLGQSAGTFANTRGREFGREFNYAAHRGSRGIGYVIAMIFKAFFIFIAGTIAISLFVAFIAFLFSGFAWAPVNNFLWTSDSQQMWAWGTLLFFVGAPIVGLLVWLIRTILNVRTPGNYLSWMFGGLWTVGWVCLIMFITSVTRDFKRDRFSETPVNIVQPTHGKLILKVSQPELEYKDNLRWMRNDGNFHGFDITDDTLKISTINIDFEKSADSLYHVIIRKEAVGKTDQDALNRVNKIQYTIASTDSILDLPNGFGIDKSSKYRIQQVIVLIQVPVNKKVKIDPSVYEKLNYVDFDFDKNRRQRRSEWRGNHEYRTNIDYTMDSTGQLVSKDDNKSENIGKDGKYKWKGADEPNTPVAPAPQLRPATAGTPYHYDSTNPPQTKPAEANSYRYDASPNNQTTKPNENKADIQKQVEQKQKEIEELKKKLNQ